MEYTNVSDDLSDPLNLKALRMLRTSKALNYSQKNKAPLREELRYMTTLTDISDTSNLIRYNSDIISFQQKANRKVILLEKEYGTKKSGTNRPTFGLTTGSDSEYFQRFNRPNRMIITQITLSRDNDDCEVFEHPDYGKNILPTWTGSCILSAVLRWDEVLYKGTPDAYLLWEKLMFFAPPDLLAALFASR